MSDGLLDQLKRSLGMKTGADVLPFPSPVKAAPEAPAPASVPDPVAELTEDMRAAADVAGEISRRSAEHLTQRADPRPRNQPIASDLALDSCDRRQVLEIVAWERKAPLPLRALEAMEGGNALEGVGLEKLRQLGFKIVRAQVPFQLRHRTRQRAAVSGKLDAVIEVDVKDRPRPLRAIAEVKSLWPWIYDAVTSALDFNQWWWTKKYITQAQIYMAGENITFGVFMLTDGRRWKPVPFALDYATAEAAWAKAEAIVDAVEEYRSAKDGEGKLPPFTTDFAQCARCPFFKRACQPPVPSTEGAAFVNDPELEQQLRRWWELRESHSDYESIDRKVKKRLREGPPLQVVGEFAVQVETKPRAARAAQPASTERWVTVSKIGEVNEGGSR